MIKWEGMRFRFLSRPLGWCFCLWLLGVSSGALTGCSLSLEDPAQDAKNKVAKPIPTTMPALVGRWKADSTYTVEDTRATVIVLEPVWLEIFADTSYAQLDTSRMTFNGKSDGVYYLSGDTLITFPSNAPPDTFMVRLTFMGNYLQLLHPADQRYSFFHKIKPQDSATQFEMLKDSLWLNEGKRLDPGIFQKEEQKKDFSYLRFRGDSMYADVRKNGVIRMDSGVLSKKGFIWTWKAAGGTKGFLADLVKEDSLRMWPLTEGRPDSGYFLYVRRSLHHPRDIDMRRLMGHMRCDSIRYPTGMMENHYGRFYDWTFTEDHKVAVETNMKAVPLFNAWSLDSGFLALDAPGYKTHRFDVDTTTGTIDLFTPDTSAFGRGGHVFQTKVDASRFAAHPLERFETASYLELVIGADTADYFFNGNNVKDQFEIARIVSDSVYWLSMVLGKSQETFQSSQPGFFFAFQGRNAALGRYACRSRPERDLVIRQTASGNPLLATGLVQGTCKVINAEIPPADSTLNLEGSFRFKRRSYGGLVGHAWSYQ
jgi:hypothetical protein